MPTTDPKKTVDMNKILRVYSGSSNRPLAEKIAGLLGVELSRPYAEAVRQRRDLRSLR